MRFWLFLGALNGFLALTAGYYGWHGLEADSGARTMFMMGADYQMWHALSLIAVAILISRFEGFGLKLINTAGVAFVVGIILFSGSLYFIGWVGYPPVKGLAPAGGFSLFLGWAALAGAALVGRRTDT